MKKFYLSVNRIHLCNIIFLLLFIFFILREILAKQRNNKNSPGT